MVVEPRSPYIILDAIEFEGRILLFVTGLKKAVCGMAQAVVSFVIERLGDLLIQEAVFLYEVRDQVQQLRNELIWMQSFLEDADAKQEGDERVRTWVSEIRDAAYDVEDVIDTFIIDVAEEKTQRRGCMASVKSYACIFNKGINLHRTGKEIKAIQKRIHDISNKREIYGIKNLGEEGMTSASEKLQQVRRSSPLADEEDIVGLEDTVKMLVAQLVKEEPRRCVISIVGMGGLGKTSLAKKIYNSINVKCHFDCQAWVYVSQEYRPKDLLQRIIKSFRSPTIEDLKMMEKSTEEDLEQQLYDLLEQRRYLVVIDDVWQSEAWESLKRAFPDKSKGSRVILTTRNRHVALCADERSPPHELRFLSKEESWDLFCKKAFLNDVSTTSCPPGLERLGREMVEKCDGLPLGIIVLGGLLSKKSPHEWQRVHDHIPQHLTKDQDQISQILTLSYNDLHYRLKSCFLYLGLFPEDSEISTEKLVRLWVAEGFIPEGERTMEDVAEDYLNELIDRSMIQVAEKSWKRVEVCRVHDLLRDLSVSKAKEEKFLDIHGNVNSPPSFKSRRHAIHSGIERYDPLHRSTPRLRSLLFFNPYSEHLRIEQLRLISDFKLLKVIDFGSSSFGKHRQLPDTIGKLIHLRYLGLQHTYLRELPPSICNLQSLQTLDLTGDFHCKLPENIGKLKQLRHLYLYWHDTGKDLRIDTLTNLQTLHYIYADAWLENDSVKLANLRELKIYVSINRAEALSDSIARLANLQSLHLKTWNEFPTLVPLSGCHRLLDLHLDGQIEKLPNPLEFPPNLTYLNLISSKLEQDPLITLEKLPNLTYLSLGHKSYEGRQMVCFDKGFPQLQVLQIVNLHRLEEWRVEEGAAPRLKRLDIESCKELKRVPEGLSFITSLQELNIKGMPRAFEDRLQGGGEDSYNIQHIPSITFSIS